MSDMTSTKPYVIAKRAVWEAYQQVKANRGAAGIDGKTIAMFEQNLSGNLDKLWNRMPSGSHCADRGQAHHRTDTGPDIPSRFLWVSAWEVGETGGSRHQKTVLAICLGGGVCHQDGL